jgi:hypothetical protein
MWNKLQVVTGGAVVGVAVDEKLSGPFFADILSSLENVILLHI